MCLDSHGFTHLDLFVCMLYSRFNHMPCFSRLSLKVIVNEAPATLFMLNFSQRSSPNLLIWAWPPNGGRLFYPGSFIFGHEPQLTTRWGLKQRSQLRASAFCSTPSQPLEPQMRPWFVKPSSTPPCYSSWTILTEKWTFPLEAKTCTLQENFTIFGWEPETHVSDLEVLTLIPCASQWAVNCLCACQKKKKK